MKIIVAGVGKVGRAMIGKLAAEGYDLTLIDSNARIIDKITEQYDVIGVQGNCATMEVLKSAGVEEADLLIAVTSADEINLLCCMTAHGMNSNLHTIARIRNPEYSDQIYTMTDIFPLSLSVNPDKQAAAELERLLKYPGFLKRETFANGRMELVELKISADSKLRDVRVVDMENIVKCRALVCAVDQGTRTITPDGNYVFREGDHIFVTSTTDNLSIMLRNLGIFTHKVRRVMICGGGRVSYYLAKSLSEGGIDVHIIEENEQRCRELSEKLPKAVIIHGDASDEQLLDSEGVSDCDALIALTGLDELNIILALYADKRGVQQTITKLGHMEGNMVSSAVSMGSSVSPKELCSSIIVQYVRALKNHTGAAKTVHSIAHDHAEALEFVIDDKCLHRGVALKNLNIKKNVLISAIGCGMSHEIPNGDSCYYLGDTVVVVTSREDAISTFNDIFER